MIRVVTAGRMRRLHEDADQARARAREVRGQADAVRGEHIRQVWELTARAESAESDAAILREHVDEFEAALKRARADLAEAVPSAGSPVVVLLHWGEVHSVHAGVHDAKAHAAAHGAAPSGWVPAQAGPARQVAWRILGSVVPGGGSCTP
ncbi:hypothetical protein [Streptomyces acidiscabies]|uniref:hypothetical protein n=1 Tax=Streptomyces acidiscabies TaxID=42234 RepID=UPI0009534AD7|nr:hypothetical protein [Streptomyces acidiscabies]